MIDHVTDPCRYAPQTTHKTRNLIVKTAILLHTTHTTFIKTSVCTTGSPLARDMVINAHAHLQCYLMWATFSGFERTGSLMVNGTDSCDRESEIGMTT